MLNLEQQRAVDAWDRPILVMAPVGTGKTNVIADRAARAIQNGFPANRILCLSFTNKAAREMRDRLMHLLGKPAGEITVRTFHGLCAGILRGEASTLGLDGDFLIYDEEDCRETFRQVWQRRRIDVPAEDLDRFDFLCFDAAGRARLSRYDDDPPRTAQEIFDERLRNSYWKALDKQQRIPFPEMLREYVAELRENHALDFADLILGVNLLWDQHPDALARWRARYPWIQVDEIQDTSRAEYRILSKLAFAGRNLSFFGDIDQTIYEWRGSAPFEVLAQYKKEFARVEEIRFIRNYRSTETILKACSAVMARELIPQVAERGEAVKVHEANNLNAEAAWIAERIQRLHQSAGLPYGDVAVLTRTNFTARDLSLEFEKLGLPHLQVEQFKFFQRAEVKNTLAHVRILINPHDGNALMRFLKTPPKGIGEAAIQDLRGAPRAAGLKLGDLLDWGTLQEGDPFAHINDEIVVFDVETTGLDIENDEILEVFALRCGGAGIAEEFHAFLKPTRPVGESENIHHISDAYLAEHGRDAKEALEEFAVFCGGRAMAGHNVLSFDLPLLRSQCARLKLTEPLPPAVFDTLDLTRRFYKMARYTLGAIAENLNLKTKPTHRADDDVRATAELLALLRAKINEGRKARRDAVAKYKQRFEPPARMVARWKARMLTDRPAELLTRILDESGLAEAYEAEKDGFKRVAHLKELVRLFEKFDEAALPPRVALTNAMNVAALGSDLDRQGGDQAKVVLLTAHQSKGLEFDTVVIAGATDDEFPSRRSQREGRQEEEHRLFYVAMSRAKKRLYLTYPARDPWGRKTLPSRYLGLLPKDAIEVE